MQKDNVETIAKEKNKSIEEVKEALRQLNYPQRVTKSSLVDGDWRMRLDVHFEKEREAPTVKTKARAKKAVSSVRDASSSTQVRLTRRPRRVAKRPAPATAAEPATKPVEESSPPPEVEASEATPPQAQVAAAEATPLPVTDVLEPPSEPAETPPSAAQTLHQRQMQYAEEQRQARENREKIKAEPPPVKEAAPAASAEATPTPASQPGKIITIPREVIEKRKSRKRRSKIKPALSGEHVFVKPVEPQIHRVEVPADGLSVNDLAKAINMKASAVIEKIKSFGIEIDEDANDEELQEAVHDFDTSWLLIEELGHKPVRLQEDTLKEKLSQITKQDEATMQGRAPIVTVMGHVDHGKTSLLDYLRKTSVVAGESGGITQHIGAYQVKTETGAITFIDTPGHALFTEMRARGVQVTDIVILVVAADEGVRPQTVEAINHAQAAGVPIIVAINKIDKPEANIKRVTTELSERGLLSEEWGGDTIFVPLSAHTGEGVEQLLETILLQAEIMELTTLSEGDCRATVIESKMDPRRGSIVAAIVRNGTLRCSDFILSGTKYGKIRTMNDENREPIAQATVSQPVEILGLSGLPQPGDDILVVRDERAAKQIAQTKINNERQQRIASAERERIRAFADITAESAPAEETTTVYVIIKGDTMGSIDVLRQAVESLADEEVGIKILHEGVGVVSENDINLATPSNAMIVTFNVAPPAGRIAKMIEEKNLTLIADTIIYEIVDAARRHLARSKKPEEIEKIIGTLQVKQVFPLSGSGTRVVAGCLVVDGVARANAFARVIRGGAPVSQNRIASLRHYREDVAEVTSGSECGLIIDKYHQVQPRDIIEIVEVTVVEAS